MLRATMTDSLGGISAGKKFGQKFAAVAIIDLCGALVTRKVEVVR